MKKFAKTLIVLGIAGSATVLPTVVHAAETDASAETSGADHLKVDPGMTPENTFYFLDKFGEKFHLLVTQNAKKKSDLYLQYAEERMAESVQLSESAKEKYLTSLADDYMKNLTNAQEKIGEVVMDEGVARDVKEQLAVKLENVTTIAVGDSVTSVLEDSQLKTLQTKKQEGYLVSNMITDLDTEKVKELSDQGLHFGQALKVIALSQKSGKSEDEIVSLLQAKKNKFGAVEKELHLEQGGLWKQVYAEKAEAAQKSFEAAVTAGDQHAIEKAGQKIDVLAKKQLGLGIDNRDSQHLNGADRKIAILQQKAAAGVISQEKADWIIQKMQGKPSKETAGSASQKSPSASMATEEASQQNIEKAVQKRAEKEAKAAVKLAEKEKKSQEKQLKADQKSAEKTKKAEEKAAKQQQKDVEKTDKQSVKVQEKAAKDEQKAKEKAAEQEKKEQEKAAENERKAKEKAAQQAKKDQAKAAENEQKAKEKAAEQARKEQEKAAENERKAKEKAAEQARKEQEKAAENERKAKEKAAEQARKEQEKAAENERKAKEKAAEQAKKEQEKAAENERKAREKAAEKDKKNQGKNDNSQDD